MKRRGCRAEKGRKSITEEGLIIGYKNLDLDTVDPVRIQ